MISLRDRVIVLNGQTKQIVRFEVWFFGPRGLCSDLHDAIDVCEKMGIDPELNISPAPVAVSEDGSYEHLISH